MDLRSCLDCRDGAPFNLVFELDEKIDCFHFGKEVPFGFRYLSIMRVR